MHTPEKKVERLFPFAIRAGILIPGYERIVASRSKLQFVLVSTDVSENTLAKVSGTLNDYPIIQHYDSESLYDYFDLLNCRVLGFEKSTLSTSIYQELREFRLNKPQDESS